MPKIEKPDRVMVKIKYCGVCMSEHYDWSTGQEGGSFGHEGMGVVTEIGENCKRVKVGYRASGPFYGGVEYVITDERNCSIIPETVKDEEAVLEPLGCLFSAVSKVRIPDICIYLICQHKHTTEERDSLREF